MQRVMSVLVLSAVIALASASMARADGFISPFAGVNFANNSGGGRGNLGADLGVMGGGVIGGELDFGYYPNFFGSAGNFGSNSVADVMGNLIIGVPAGGTHGPGVRPYAVGGLGLMRSRTTDPLGNGHSTNDLGFDIGAGVMGYFSNKVGLRGDVRYFRDVHDTSTVGAASAGFGQFHFIRASIGVVFRP
jgi:hypothetical protein